MNNEQASELLKCYNDIKYFADTYVQLSTPTGKIQCNLTDFQCEVIARFTSDRMFFLSSERMEGKTTIAAIILLHQALFTEYRVSLVFARKQSMSNDILEMIAKMYDLLPGFLKHTKMTTRNKSKITFDNLCSIISAGSNVNYGRGRAISTIYIDESEWFDNLGDVLTGLYPCMAGVPYSRVFALSSTRTGDKFRSIGVAR